MTANAPDAVIRMPGHWFNDPDASNTPCDVCGGHLPDHDWADLDDHEPPRVVDCSGERR